MGLFKMGPFILDFFNTHFLYWTLYGTFLYNYRMPSEATSGSEFESLPHTGIDPVLMNVL